MGRLILSLLAGVLIGFLLGGLWFHRPPDERALASGTGPSRTKFGNVAAAPESDPPARRPDRLRERTVGAENPDRGDRIEITPELLVRLVSTSQPRLEDRTVLISNGDTVAAALAVTPGERSALEQEWARVRDRMRTRQKSSLDFVEGDEELWIGAGPFDGKADRDAFGAAVMDVLGGPRGRAFLELTRADDAFGAWGERPSAAYSIRIESQADGTPVYRITERESAGGPAGRSWVSTVIPPHIREITNELGIPESSR